MEGEENEAAMGMDTDIDDARLDAEEGCANRKMYTCWGRTGAAAVWACDLRIGEAGGELLAEFELDKLRGFLNNEVDHEAAFRLRPEFVRPTIDSGYGAERVGDCPSVPPKA